MGKSRGSAIRNLVPQWLIASLSFGLLLISAGCVSQDNGWARANLNATAWVQTSEEYRSLALSAYNWAQQRIDEAISDPKWTALPEQEGKDIEGLPLAVILDVDETVLDNSAYQAWAVQNRQQWSPKTLGPC